MSNYNRSNSGRRRGKRGNYNKQSGESQHASFRPPSGSRPFPGYYPSPNYYYYASPKYFFPQGFYPRNGQMPIFQFPSQVSMQTSNYTIKSIEKRDMKKLLFGNECIYVGDIPKDVSEKELKNEFEHAGKIVDIYYPSGLEGSNHKGYAFLKFEAADQAIKARANKGQTLLRGQAVRILEVINLKEKSDIGNIIMKNITQVTKEETEEFLALFKDEYTLKVNPEKKEAYVFFKSLKTEDFLNKFKEVEKSEQANECKFFVTIKDKRIEVEPLRSKWSLYIKSLPYEDFDVKELVQFLEEEGKRKLLSMKLKKNEEHKKSWGMFQFSNYEQAKQVFENYQGVQWKGQAMEIYWVNKKKKSQQRKDVERLLTSSIRIDVNRETVQEFFKTIDESASVKLIDNKNVNFSRSATIFVSLEGAEKIKKYLSDSSNLQALGSIYFNPGKVNIVNLVSKNALSEFKKLKSEKAFQKRGFY